jgi:hypothetical protein
MIVAYKRPAHIAFDDITTAQHLVAHCRIGGVTMVRIDATIPEPIHGTAPEAQAPVAESGSAI